MNYKKLSILLFVFVLTLTASAQEKNYDKVYASLNFASFYPTNIGMSEVAFRGSVRGMGEFQNLGFSVGYAKGINLSSTLPISLEFGGEVNYFSDSQDVTNNSYSNSYTFSAIILQIPVNLTYAIPVTNKLSIAPFAGLNLKCNMKCEIKDTKLTRDYYNFLAGVDMENLFGVSEIGNIFQLGANLGVNFIIAKKYSIGYRYQPDFNTFYEYEHDGKGFKFTRTNHYITAGYIFKFKKPAPKKRGIVGQ